LLAIRTDFDELALEMKQGQKIGEVTFDEA
jgi:hypothetical protein